MEVYDASIPAALLNSTCSCLANRQNLDGCNVLLFRVLLEPGDLVVTSPRELVEIPRTYVRFSLSFPEEDLCPVHEFSWWSLGRNAVSQTKDVEGCGGRLAYY